MKKFKFFLPLLAFMAMVFGAFAQNDEPNFYIIETMKSKPGMTDDYVDAEMKVWKKLHQERKKQGKITEWYFYNVRYPSGTSTAYDFVTVTGVKGWAGLGAFYEGWDFAALTKSLTKEEVAIVNKTEMLRDLTTHQVFYAGDFASTPNFDPLKAKFLSVNYFKVPENRWSEYLDMETKLVKPMHVEMMNTGKGRSVWALYSRVAPYDPAVYPYNAFTLDGYNKWEDMNANGDFEATLKKIHPGMSEEYYNRQIEEARTMLKQELWVLLDGI
ncbi:MAG: hypothetical protein ACKV1O_18580 [Saprospiraceae bacterium]